MEQLGLMDSRAPGIVQDQNARAIFDSNAAAREVAALSCSAISAGFNSIFLQSRLLAALWSLAIYRLSGFSAEGAISK